MDMDIQSKLKKSIMIEAVFTKIMNKTLIFFKIVLITFNVLIPVSFQLVEAL